MSRCSFCLPVPPPSCVSAEGSEGSPWRNTRNEPLGFLQDPAIHLLPSTALSRRAPRISLCVYQCNAGVAGSSARDTYDSAATGTRCEVWPPPCTRWKAISQSVCC